MVDVFDDVPDQVRPYLTLTEPNQTVRLVEGPLGVMGPTGSGTLDADLVFRWLPRPGVVFDGLSTARGLDFASGDWSLVAAGGEPVIDGRMLVTRVSEGPGSTRVGGTLNGSVAVGSTEFDLLRFCLVNFPSYNGHAARSQSRQEVQGGRMRLDSADARCRVDAIPEASKLLAANAEGGFVVSHVGEWIPDKGLIGADEAVDVVGLLGFWFGFLRGAWTGPVFAQGLRDGEVVWQLLGNPKLSESRYVTTWLPETRPLDVSDAFRGFAQRWNDPSWRGPLKTAISWLIQANAPGTILESKIVLAQVALELLAWVHVVETEKLHSVSDFDPMSAAGKIRTLLSSLRIPLEIPNYLTDLPAVCAGEVLDGPCAITRVRNGLVHATHKKRAMVNSLTGTQRLECSQLAQQYVELAVLRLCNHQGYYAARGYKGWKGDDEIPVPWQ